MDEQFGKYKNPLLKKTGTDRSDLVILIERRYREYIHLLFFQNLCCGFMLILGFNSNLHLQRIHSEGGFHLYVFGRRPGRCRPCLLSSVGKLLRVSC